MSPYLLSAIFVVVAALLCWLAGPVLHLQGAALTALRIGILLLGVAAAGVAYWLLSRGTSTAAPGAEAAEADELGTLVREAEQRLRGARRPRSRSLATLPLLYLLGASNSAKTTIALKSGLDPELIAGQAYAEEIVARTRLANIFFAEDAVVVDAGAAFTAKSSLWTTLVRRTRPGMLRSVISGRRPLRAAVVCVSSDAFFGARAAEMVASLGRETNEVLRKVAQGLGADLPVYVVLTKLDRVPGFAEYVRHLNTEEASEHLGTLFPAGSVAGGVYAERASSVIASALDKLFFSLGEFRLEMLGREGDPAPLPSIYQFPRELQKLRGNLAAYLLEVARPSHLHATPTLRGLFFVGVRAQMIEEAVSAPAAMPRPAGIEDDATGILSLRQIESAAAKPSAPLNVSRRVAQWCFLPRLFPEIFLAQGERSLPSATSARVVFLRRLALATAAALLLTSFVGASISYGNNARLERAIHDAAASLPPQAPAATFALAAQIAELDRLRESILQLEQYKRDGAPLAYRWGLYRGDSLLQPARQLYFERFRWLLLVKTQENLHTLLGALPATAPQDADYIAAYNPLRAYLITTAFHQYSTVDFLPPVLVDAWLNGRRPLTDEQVSLADRQFRFYAEELRPQKLYAIAADPPTLVRARAYLNSFGSFDRVYQNILAAASHTAPTIDFNRLYPGSAATVVESHLVPGAFSAAGFQFVQHAIEHPDSYFAGEAWVLGDGGAMRDQGAALGQRLSARYADDFREQWQQYLRSASVVRYRSLTDARAKLQSLSSPASALLALLFTASRNTAPAGALAHEFQPTQAVVPANLKDRLIAPGNTVYVNGLVGLDGAVSQLTQDKSAASNPAAAQPVIAAAVSAHAAVSQTAQAFDIDQTGHVEQTVTKLLQEPITFVEAVVRSVAPEQVNQGGRAFCAAFSPLLTKYPFDRAATAEATPAEVAAVLKPSTGQLWQFHEASLKPLLVQEGAQWVAAPNAPLKPTSQFVHFFNRVAGLSTALFANGAAAPTLSFTAHLPPSPGIQSVTLALDADRLSGANVSKQFTWSTQTARQAQIIASYGSNNLPLQFSGSWSLFRLVDRGRVEQAANPVRLAYPLEISGTPIVVDGIPLTERIELSGPAASLLRPGSLAGLHCVAQVAHE